MKKSIFAASVLFITGFHQAKAQETPDDIVPGTYYQDHVITNYTGTWKWTSGTDTFTIVLVKKKRNLTKFSVDVLSGGYRYVKNGVEVINTLNDVNIVDINATGSPKASLQSAVRDGNGFLFNFTDKIYNNKWGHVHAVITPAGNTYNFTWKLSGTGVHMSLPGDPPFQEGYSVPMDMVLVKQ